MTVDLLFEWLNGLITNMAGNGFLLIVAILVPCLALFGFITIYAFVVIYMELKVSSFIQDKVGPMGQGVGLHAGKWGVLQPIADALKLLTKEDIIPDNADKPLFILAPFMIFIGAFIGFIALPFGESIIIADLNIGIFYILAVGSFGVIALIMAGWASNNKWSLYGGMRSAAQIISYEIPAGLSIIVVIMLSSTLSMQGIIKYQEGGIFNWIIFSNPFSFVAFFIYFISAIAETNRTPFDIPEAESELVGGFHTEYSGMRFAFFFLSEYANMFVVSGVAAAGFLGGWQSPISGYFNTPFWGVFWMLSKIMFLVFMMIWMRWTFPRLRVDQLMNVSWKVFLPISLINIFGVGIWTLVFG
ncbi:MAG: NADH-quinone oxidoreductase subunit NuoH [Candidatus Neomarinimicrobiota bacterium]|nr:NADH-quinone oxidoreductase subunit NuoH [Candidatus Neomarinimicrobiota bacterium]